MRTSTRPNVPDVALLLLALLATGLGMGWLALAMDVHWNQVRNAPARSRAVIVALRALGAAALLGALLLCLVADTATMAVLVWMMMLAVSAAAVAFILSWRPRVLAPLAAVAGLAG
jgi:uncharacterized protein DUF3325